MKDTPIDLMYRNFGKDDRGTSGERGRWINIIASKRSKHRKAGQYFIYSVRSSHQALSIKCRNEHIILNGILNQN